MATLAESVDAAETDWLVSADIPDTVDYLTVESEVVQVTATFPAQYQARDGSTSEPRIRVVRAAGGTTAASHADGTTLTPLIPPSAAGGGAAEAGTVIVTPPTEVDIGAALEAAPTAPSASNPYPTLADVEVIVTESRVVVADVTDTDTTILGNFLAADVGSRLSGPLDDGVNGAPIPSGTTIVSVVNGVSAEMSQAAALTAAGITVRVSDPDPGAIGAGRFWVQREVDGGGFPVAGPPGLSLRNAANDGWYPLGPALYNDDGARLGLLEWDSASHILQLELLDSDASVIAAVKLTAANVANAGIELTLDQHAIVMSSTGIAVLTPGTFTYNGDEVATVP